jgi:hypothetical protein
MPRIPIAFPGIHFSQQLLPFEVNGFLQRRKMGTRFMGKIQALQQYRFSRTRLKIFFYVTVSDILFQILVLIYTFLNYFRNILENS